MKSRRLCGAALAASFAVVGTVAPATGGAASTHFCSAKVSRIYTKFARTHHKPAQLTKEIRKLQNKYHCTLGG